MLHDLLGLNGKRFQNEIKANISGESGKANMEPIKGKVNFPESNDDKDIII